MTEAQTELYLKLVEKQAVSLSSISNSLRKISDATVFFRRTVREELERQEQGRES